MRKYFAVIPFFMFVALGCVTQAVYGDTDIAPIIDQTRFFVSSLERQNIELPTSAKASAEAFAEHISTLEHLTATRSLSATETQTFRRVITDQFHEAVTLIMRLEDEGRFEDAAPARDSMQISIDLYMHDTSEHTPQITRDLEVFSKFMTETLIKRLVEASS